MAEAVLSKEWRRRRRHRLYQVGEQSKGSPSFVSLLCLKYGDAAAGSENENDKDTIAHGADAVGSTDAATAMIAAAEHEEESQRRKIMLLEQLPKRIRIDLDAELGLKDSQPALFFKQYVDHEAMQDGLFQQDLSGFVAREGIGSASDLGRHDGAIATKQPPHAVSPLDAGWYEGSCPVRLPEDIDYLSKPQQWVRQNIEFFSATRRDIDAFFSMGQRQRGGGGGASGSSSTSTSPVIGQVGLRCRHCHVAAANDAIDAADGTTTTHSWTPGSMIFPSNAAALSSIISNKFMAHLEDCPHVSYGGKMQLLGLLQEPQDGTGQQHASTGGTGSGGGTTAGASQQRAARPGGVSPMLYNVISARRLGLVDLEQGARSGGAGSGGGMRFGRDLNLEPLAFATIRMWVESKNQGLNDEGGGNDAVVASEPRIAADAESEAVLAEAVAESMSQHHQSSIATAALPSDGNEDADMSAAAPTSAASSTVATNVILCRVEDKTLVTDFLFLTIRQMAICHTRPSDFATRGKKAKLMRPGFAGFCCRWCHDNAPSSGGASADPSLQQPPNNTAVAVVDWTVETAASSRSFSSAAEGLSSSISNTFATHLQKCSKVPVKIKKALLAYKKLHHRQMAQLPYGSQTRLFRELWARFRAADKSEEEAKRELPEGAWEAMKMESSDAVPPRSRLDTGTHETSDANMAEVWDEGPHQRDPNLPVCDDAETQQILVDAETNWDPSVNDHLMLPRDRHLVSDYVFLVMRQMKMIFSDSVDSQRRRHSPNGSGFPGLACIHCLGQDQGNVSPAGRSFPSAPDNFASALNTSLYNHMQACLYTPDSMKRALANTRKVHSAQCASIKFGSQRRYFNLLFERLKNAYDGSLDTEAANAKSSSSDSFFKELGFMEIPSVDKLRPVVVCRACRMVPIQFRVSDSTFIGKPRVDLVRQHHLRCKKSQLDLHVVVDLLDETLRRSSEDSMDSGNDGDLALLESETFRTLVGTCVANEGRLVRAFTSELRQMLLSKRLRVGELQSATAVSAGVDLDGLWHCFPSSVDAVAVLDAFRAFAQRDGSRYCPSDDLRENAGWVDFLSLISPSLALPEQEVADEIVV